MVEHVLGKDGVTGSIPVSSLNEGISYGALYKETEDITYMPEFIPKRAPKISERFLARLRKG